MNIRNRDKNISSNDEFEIRFHYWLLQSAKNKMSNSEPDFQNPKPDADICLWHQPTLSALHVEPLLFSANTWKLKPDYLNVLSITSVIDGKYVWRGGVTLRRALVRVHTRQHLRVVYLHLKYFDSCFVAGFPGTYLKRNRKINISNALDCTIIHLKKRQSRKITIYESVS